VLKNAYRTSERPFIAARCVLVTASPGDGVPTSLRPFG
jgi:hypothetical protein